MNIIVWHSQGFFFPVLGYGAKSRVLRTMSIVLLPVYGIGRPHVWMPSCKTWSCRWLPYLILGPLYSISQWHGTPSKYYWTLFLLFVHKRAGFYDPHILIWILCYWYTTGFDQYFRSLLRDASRMIVHVINSGLHQMFQNVTTVDISQSRMNLMTVVS